MSSVEEIIDRMIEALNAKNQQDMQDLAGFSLGTASKWKKRGSVPDGSIAKVSDLSGINFHWLKTGVGEKRSEGKPLDKELLQVIIEAVEEGLGQLNLELKPDKKAELIIHIYEMYEEEKDVDKKTVLRLIRLAA